MSVWNIFYYIIIMPLQMAFEEIFLIIYDYIDIPGIAIIVFSFVINILILPVYNRANEVQRKENELQTKLHDGVKHIKKTFKGDERMMILQTYYRQNGYKPTYVFRSAVSLLLEIPFFIAAYRFLIQLQMLHGREFFLIQDLGRPDGICNIGNYSVNLLPIVMTALNIISCVIYTKGYPIVQKVQLFFMAIFFFFFLYKSPSGIVLYWTFNNLFSLIKALPRIGQKIFSKILLLIGTFCCVIGFEFGQSDDSTKMKAFLFLGAVCLIPLIGYYIKNRKKPIFKKDIFAYNKKIFIAGGMYLTVLVGAVIPAAVIKSSPQEFINIYSYQNPLWYIISSLCIALGTFIIWNGVFYWLAGTRFRGYFDIGIWILSIIATLNYMFFGKQMGTLDNALTFANGIVFSKRQILINASFILFLLVVLIIFYKKSCKYIQQVLVVGICALSCMTIVNIGYIIKDVSKITDNANEENLETPTFTLSENGQNVIVIMLDRSMNAYVPYIMNEKPELKEMFSGFTYYSNTLSYGICTNLGSPALFGGYEYTPLEMNNRKDETLVSKHNEALKVMPVLFDENNYKVTVCDPTYANYCWIPDLSIYDEYPNIQTYITKGCFSNEQTKIISQSANKTKFYGYSIMKISPLCLQKLIYNSGNYISVEGQTQIIKNNYEAEGLASSFYNAYLVLKNLGSMTNVTQDTQNTFLMLTNDTTHDVQLLQEPEYIPQLQVDNTAYEQAHKTRYSQNGDALNIETEWNYKTYQCNMAALLQIGEWLQFLKKNNVYDNTRIILVGDHGCELDTQQYVMHVDGEEYDMQYFHPLLMVKDFGSKVFSTSDTFMTNADVPTLAIQNLIESPVNPFTNKEINDEAKRSDEQYVFWSPEWHTDRNNGNVFIPGTWFSVHDNVEQIENWSLVQKNSTSPFAEQP